MIPSRFIFLESFPVLPSGKIDRQALPIPNDKRPDLGYEYTPPKDDLEKKIVGIWEKVMEVYPIGVEDDFFDLGGHSLLAVRLFTKLEDELNIKLPISILLNAATVRQQTEYIRNRDDETIWTPLIPIQVKGALPPIFGIPGRGGNPIRFNDLSKRLGSNQPLYLLQYRGLDGRELPIETVEELARDFLDAIRSAQSKGPYFLIGASFGGLVVYEIAQQLLARGEKVAFVGLIDTYAPGYLKFAKNFSKTEGTIFKISAYFNKHWSNFKVATWRGKWNYIIRYIGFSRLLFKNFTWIIKQKNPRSQLHNLPYELVRVETTNLSAAKKYIPKPFRGKITLFRAGEQPHYVTPDENLGWGNVEISEFEVVEIPGHHGSILFEPRVEVLAKELERLLEEARLEYSE